jgi:pimeloyl-ACP methyl ester carboxylesterase
VECRVGDIGVYYEVIGEGRPIVMLHGLGGDHSEMVFELEHLFARRDGWKRIYLDLPGMGKTPAPPGMSTRDEVLQVVEDFIDRVIPRERFIAAGRSLGAYLARGLVFRRGASMDGVLLNVPAVTPRPDRNKRAPRIVLKTDPNIVKKAQSEGIDLAWLEEMTVAYNADLLDYARVFHAMPRPADPQVLERFWENHSYAFDVNTLSRPFPAPALFIMGRQDRIGGDYRGVWKILDDYPRATFAVLDRSGHLVAGEQRTLYSALVHEWLDRVEDWVTTNPS